nr:tetratricopeptide repeat protein [Candidatus Omnitrophota bacterium]
MKPKANIDPKKLSENNSSVHKTSFIQKISLMFLGLFLSLIIIEATLRLGGFIFLSLQEQRNRASIYKKGTYRIMCLGESTTAIGGENSYPSQLEEVLNSANIGVTFTVINKAIPSINTSVILANLEDNLKKYKPDMVTVMMGINDRGEHMPYNIASEPKVKKFFKSFRVYKLSRFIWIHIKAKLKEIGRCYAAEDKNSTPIIYNNYLEQGWLSNKERNFSKAEEAFKKAKELNPQDDRPYIGLGRTYMNSERYSQAREEFKKALEINSKSEHTYAGLGWVYHYQGLEEEALNAFKKAIEVNPKNDWPYTELGWYYKEQKQYLYAQEAFKKAIELNSDNYQAHSGLGWAYLETGQNFKAYEVFKRALELNSQDERIYIGLGWCYKYLGDHEKSEAAFIKATEINSKNDWAYAELGGYYEDAGEYLKAQEAFKKALELNPKNTRAYYGLGLIYSAQDYNKQAEEIFKKALNIIPDNEWIYIGLGWVYFKSEQYQKAYEQFKKALEINPKNDLAYRRLRLVGEKTDNSEIIQECDNKLRQIESSQYDAVTRENYNKLKDILDKWGVKLVCVQYPMRSIKPLLDMLDNKKGIIFVDNEAIFKEAVSKGSYTEYF